MVTLIAFVVLVGSIAGFATLWTRAESANASLQAKIGLLFEAIDVLGKKNEADLTKVRDEIISRASLEPLVDDTGEEEEATKILPAASRLSARS